MTSARWWIVASIALLFGLGFLLVPSGGGDDTHITYWSAHALARFGEIVNYNGERVEQSSSLALTVWLALLSRLTRLPIPLLGYLSGLLFGAATIVAMVRLARVTAPRAGELAAPLLATAACFLFWSTSGMETTMAAFAAVATLGAAGRWIDAAGERRPRCAVLFAGAALAVALFAAVRPESPLLLGSVLLAQLAWCGLEAWRRPSAEARGRLLGALALLAWAALVVGALLAFRKHCFGAWFPNPVRAKAGGFHIRNGLEYLWTSFTQTNALLVPVLLVGLAVVAREMLRFQARPALVLTAAYAVAYLGFIVQAGGDWMPNGRFLDHAFPALLVLVVTAIDRLCRRRPAALLTTALLLCMNLAGAAEMARSDRNSAYPGHLAPALVRHVRANVEEPEVTFPEIVNKPHLRDTPLLAALLGVVRHLGPTPEQPIHMMSGQAGMVPYHVITRHYGAVRFVDMFSLTTDYFLRCVDPKKLRRSALGSSLPYEYYFKNHERIARDCGVPKPTIIFSTSLRPDFRRLLDQHGYTVVFNQTGELSSADRFSFFQGKASINTFIAVLKERAEGLEVVKPPLPPARFGGEPARGRQGDEGRDERGEGSERPE